MAANASKSFSLHARSTRREVCAGKIMVLIFYRVNAAASREPELWFRPGFCRVVRSPSSAGRHPSLSLSDWFSVAVICLPLFGRRYPVVLTRSTSSAGCYRSPSSVGRHAAVVSGLCRPAGRHRPAVRYPTVVCPMPFLETIAPPGFSWLRPYSATSFFERLRVLIVR